MTDGQQLNEKWPGKSLWKIRNSTEKQYAMWVIQAYKSLHYTHVNGDAATHTWKTATIMKKLILSSIIRLPTCQSRKFRSLVVQFFNEFLVIIDIRTFVILYQYCTLVYEKTKQQIWPKTFEHKLRQWSRMLLLLTMSTRHFR